MKSILLLITFLCASWVAQAVENPWVGVDLFINPAYVAEVQTTIDANPSKAALLEKAQNVSVAFWIDVMAKIPNVSTILQQAESQSTQTGTKVLSTFIIYDLPNRDCAAAASNGEIPCADAVCADGITTYQTKYIDPIVKAFAQYPNNPIVAIIEPDSLPNLVTNLAVPKCQEAQTAYMTCVSYAITQLSKLSHVTMYIDAAHGGWLGWTNNLIGAAQIFSKVLTMAGGPQLIRGFATNTANYQPLGTVNSTADPCGLKPQYNFAINEAIYIQLLDKQLQAAGITGMGYITDTSRNGVIDERKSCSNWCNINGAGLGERPTSEAAEITGNSLIDALYWVKVPGESDGSSNSTAPRYDFHCGSSDSYIPAPQAGQWFADFFVMLCENAVPAL